MQAASWMERKGKEKKKSSPKGRGRTAEAKPGAVPREPAFSQAPGGGHGHLRPPQAAGPPLASP